jgi:hypothetical protein
LALQWMDDFTIYGTDTNRALRLLDGPYANTIRADLQVDPDPTAGGNQVLRVFGGGTGGDIRKILSSSQTTVGVAARYWITFLPIGIGSTNCPNIVTWKDTNNIVHCYVRIDASGYLRVYRAANGGLDTLIGSSSSPVIVTNAWRHIECKMVLNNVASGSVEVRLEGAVVVNITGVKTTSDITGASTTTIDAVSIQSQQDASGPVLYVKDFIVWDGSGAANNNFMGSCQVYKILPDADDGTLNWTPSTGTTGFNQINDTTPNDDSGYISAPVPLPSPCQFTMSDLPINTSSVRGVMLIHRSRKTDGGDGQLQASLISGANTGNGSNRTITTAYTYWWDMFDTEPVSGSSWSKTLVNAAKMKLNRTV